MKLLQMVISQRKFAILIALAAVVALTGSAFADDEAVVDWSADITTAIVGLVAGVVAAIAVGFGAAALIKVSRTAARAALKAIGMIH